MTDADTRVVEQTVRIKATCAMLCPSCPAPLAFLASRNA